MLLPGDAQARKRQILTMCEGFRTFYPFALKEGSEDAGIEIIYGSIVDGLLIPFRLCFLLDEAVDFILRHPHIAVTGAFVRTPVAPLVGDIAGFIKRLHFRDFCDEDESVVDLENLDFGPNEVKSCGVV